jgi:hypothetical protein
MRRSKKRLKNTIEIKKQKLESERKRIVLRYVLKKKKNKLCPTFPGLPKLVPLLSLCCKRKQHVNFRNFRSKQLQQQMD